MIKKDTWVLVRRVILNKDERPSTLPKDTLETPLMMWVKGHLKKDALLGDDVQITTLTGRTEYGVLLEENPTYHHGFGDFMPELQLIDKIVKSILTGGDCDE